MKQYLPMPMTFTLFIMLSFLTPKLYAVENCKNLLTSSVQSSHKEIRQLALELHGGQMYGEHPYSYHLHKVRTVLKRFGFGPKDSSLGEMLGTAAYLHDAIEDTSLTYEELKSKYSVDIADIVFGVTNEPRREGQSQKERKQKTFIKTASDYRSKVLKLADRIANAEESLFNLLQGKETKIDKYIAEQPLFEQYLYNPQEPELWPMWNHLRDVIEVAKELKADKKE